VILLDEVDAWYGELVKEDRATAEQVTAAIDKLEADGPSLGRPLVDRIKGIRHNRIAPTSSSVRVRPRAPIADTDGYVVARCALRNALNDSSRAGGQSRTAPMPGSPRETGSPGHG
jgi:hypothetical protein